MHKRKAHSVHALCIEQAPSIGVAMVANRNTLIMTLMDCVPQFEVHHSFLPNLIDLLRLIVSLSRDYLC